MTDDLNIRAARCLGCVVEKTHTAFTGELHLAISNFPYHHGGLYSHNEDLKFTTSYDWAMLGVAALGSDKLCDYLFALIRIGTSKMNLDSLLKMSDTQLMYFHITATPHQITQAWVEILEANDA